MCTADKTALWFKQYTLDITEHKLNDALIKVGGKHTHCIDKTKPHSLILHAEFKRSKKTKDLTTQRKPSYPIITVLY